MLQPAGLERLWAVLAGAEQDTLGAIGITDGQQTATAPITASTVEVVDGAARLTVEATFGEDEANFEWRERLVFTESGVLLDRTEQDMGRKSGGEWVATAPLELVPEGER